MISENVKSGDCNELQKRLREERESNTALNLTIASLQDELARQSGTLNFTQYQNRAGQTAIYPKEQGVEYTALGLTGEAGEIANKVKKVLRGDYDKDALRQMLAGEIGDVLWYTAMLATELDLNLEDIANGNLDKLASRKQRGVIAGSGDNR